MAAQKLDVCYFPQKDILTINILPRRPSVMGTTRYNFLVAYDRANKDEIVGFEILDFSYFVPHMYEPGVVPALNSRFDVQVSEPIIQPGGQVSFQVRETPLTDATLHQVLEWTYQEFVLKRIPAFLLEATTA